MSGYDLFDELYGERSPAPAGTGLPGGIPAGMIPRESPAGRVYTVGELGEEIARLFGNDFYVTVRGELSNCGSRTRGSYFYCVIKDSSAEIPVAFRIASIQKQLDRIKDGVTAEIRGRVTYYRQKGRVTLWGSALTLRDRMGELYARFLRSMEKLRAEGLFATEIKKPIPEVIRSVGIITSPDGMAVRDVIRTVRRRNRFIDIVVYPAAVQGADAPASLMTALWHANLHNACDVLLVVRGGGSAEDLSCFNSEELARYARQSLIPVISGVGHEGDYTILDYAADLRASTPTAAAEIVSRSLDHSIETLNVLKRNLFAAGTGRVRFEAERFGAVKARFARLAPENRIAALRARADGLRARLEKAGLAGTAAKAAALGALKGRLLRAGPGPAVAAGLAACALARQKMTSSMEGRLAGLRADVAARAALLDANNPLKILAQGYSITLNADGTGIDLATVRKGDVIRTVLADGELTSVVTEAAVKKI